MCLNISGKVPKESAIRWKFLSLIGGAYVRSPVYSFYWKKKDNTRANRFETIPSGRQARITGATLL